MVYGIIALALLALSVKGYCGKRISCYASSTADALLFNLLRMVFCIAIGVLFVFFEGAQGSLLPEWQMLLICALSGLANAAFLVGWLLAIQKNSMVLVDVGLTMGSLLPAVLCACFFGEAISIPKMLGFAMILGATVILAGGKPKTASQSSASGLILLVFAAIGDGVSGFAQQLYKQFYTEAGALTHNVFYPKSVFHVYTFFFAAVALLLFWAGTLIRNRKTNEKGTRATKAHLSIGIVLHILTMAICLFAANYLQTVATADLGMPSQVLYPIIKGGCLITVTFTAMLFFGERITRRSLLGSAVAMLGIVSMSLL